MTLLVPLKRLQAAAVGASPELLLILGLFVQSWSKPKISGGWNFSGRKGKLLCAALKEMIELVLTNFRSSHRYWWFRASGSLIAGGSGARSKSSSHVLFSSSCRCSVGIYVAHLWRFWAWGQTSARPSTASWLTSEPRAGGFTCHKYFALKIPDTANTNIWDIFCPLEAYSSYWL